MSYWQAIGLGVAIVGVGLAAFTPAWFSSGVVVVGGVVVIVATVMGR